MKCGLESKVMRSKVTSKINTLPAGTRQSSYGKQRVLWEVIRYINDLGMRFCSFSFVSHWIYVSSWEPLCLVITSTLSFRCLVLSFAGIGFMRVYEGFWQLDCEPLYYLELSWKHIAALYRFSRSNQGMSLARGAFCLDGASLGVLILSICSLGILLEPLYLSDKVGSVRLCVFLLLFVAKYHYISTATMVL